MTVSFSKKSKMLNVVDVFTLAVVPVIWLAHMHIVLAVAHNFAATDRPGWVVQCAVTILLCAIHVLVATRNKSEARRRMAASTLGRLWIAAGITSTTIEVALVVCLASMEWADGGVKEVATFVYKSYIKPTPPIVLDAFLRTQAAATLLEVLQWSFSAKAEKDKPSSPTPTLADLPPLPVALTATPAPKHDVVQTATLVDASVPKRAMDVPVVRRVEPSRLAPRPVPPTEASRTHTAFSISNCEIRSMRNINNVWEGYACPKDVAEAILSSERLDGRG